MADIRQSTNGADLTAQLHQSSAYQLAPGTILQDRYRVDRVLGKGGMGHVYLVRDEHFADGQTPPVRAMKEMIPRINDLQNNMINFTREAQVLEQLRHPSVPRVYDSFRAGDRAYLVLEYIEGSDLEQVLEKTSGQLSWQVVGDWMLQLCEIVAYLHTRQPPIIFRDFKPSNVILTPEGRIVLIDFGIAKSFTAGGPQTMVGTTGYAAPEQYKGKAEMRSDIFALGAMMHHLLTRSDPRFQTPFSFSERPPRALNPAIPPELERVVMRCVEYEMDKRFPNVFELRKALAAALGIPVPDGQNADYFASYVATGTARGAFGAAGPVTMQTRTTRVRWRFQTEDEVRSTPTVANGVLYIGSYDNNLYALDAGTGALRWKFASDGGVCCTPAVWRNVVVFGSEDFNVYGIDTTSGKEAWRYRTWNHVVSSPRVHDDRLYIGSDDGHMHQIDPRTGRALEKFRTYREVQSTAACANGLLYFGSNDEYLYAVDALTLERKWLYRTHGQVISSPAVADGYVYFGSMDFGVYSLDAKTGWLGWREATDKFVISSPLIVGDRLYIGSTDKYLYCLDRRTGHRIWRFEAGNQVNSTPAFSNGVIYFGCLDGALYAVDATHGKLIWRYQTPEMICGSPVIVNGLLYIGSCDGAMYALDANT
jgi:outer membrane protein assembly factor BamB